MPVSGVQPRVRVLLPVGQDPVPDDGAVAFASGRTVTQTSAVGIPVVVTVETATSGTRNSTPVLGVAEMACCNCELLSSRP